jgi:hypothetical protein
VSVDAAAARFPEVGNRAGFYESFYLRACDPAARRGVWIRHTVHKKPGVGGRPAVRREGDPSGARAVER